VGARTGFTILGRHGRADGEVRGLSTEARPRLDAGGAFLGMIGVNIDVTEARRAEHHHRLLINELNHRVKNTLATVQSLAHQTLGGGHAPAQVAGLLEGRLMALSAAHNVRTTENGEAAALGAVVREALRAFEDPGGWRFEVAGPSARIGPQAALAVALAVHELATNAVKYGALSADDGVVEVAWREDRDGAAMLVEWRERGGPPVTPPTHRGFGSRLLASLAADLGAAAALDFAESGLVCRLTVPLTGT
jgi:two-component sensor histidine kinase